MFSLQKKKMNITKKSRNFIHFLLYVVGNVKMQDKILLPG